VRFVRVPETEFQEYVGRQVTKETKVSEEVVASVHSIEEDIVRSTVSCARKNAA
jgi:hypothetical protein